MANGVHIIEYIDVDGHRQKETIKGSHDKVNKRADELREHDCKVVKTQMFVNWKDTANGKITQAIMSCDDLGYSKPGVGRAYASQTRKVVEKYLELRGVKKNQEKIVQFVLKKMEPKPYWNKEVCIQEALEAMDKYA